MTDKELIEAQERDIRNLLNIIREKDEVIASSNSKSVNYPTDYKFDTPYFRIDKYYITCYRLVNIVIHKWHKTMHEPGVEFRFNRIFYLRLENETVSNCSGGNQLLKSCITWDSLKEKLLRKMKIATNKNNTNEVAHLNKVLLLLKQKVNECDAYFNEEVE